MKSLSWVLGMAGAWLAVACGSSSDGAADGAVTEADASAFVGIYKSTSHTENKTSCAAPGDAVQGIKGDPYFVIYFGDIPEYHISYVTLISCASVSECQAVPAKLKGMGFVIDDYSFTLSTVTNDTTLSGFEASTGTSGDGNSCIKRHYSDHVLTVAADHSVHLESRLKYLADRAQDSDGFCFAEVAQEKSEAAGKPCSELQVLDGTFVQAL